MGTNKLRCNVLIGPLGARSHRPFAQRGSPDAVGPPFTSVLRHSNSVAIGAAISPRRSQRRCGIVDVQSGSGRSFSTLPSHVRLAPDSDWEADITGGRRSAKKPHQRATSCGDPGRCLGRGHYCVAVECKLGSLNCPLLETSLRRKLHPAGTTAVWPTRSANGCLANCLTSYVKLLRC